MGGQLIGTSGPWVEIFKFELYGQTMGKATHLQD